MTFEQVDRYRQQRAVWREKRQLYASMSGVYHRTRELYRELRTVYAQLNRLYTEHSEGRAEELDRVQAQRQLIFSELAELSLEVQHVSAEIAEIQRSRPAWLEPS